MDDPAVEETDEVRWREAAAYMEAHGDAWRDEAIAHLIIIADGDQRAFGRWIDLIEKMRAINEAPRQ
jgi:hypothetical protein